MKSISSVEVARLVQELKESEGARIEKIYQSGDDFFIVAKKSRMDKKIIAVVLPSAVFFSSKKPEVGLPPPFCSKLRNIAGRAIITKIEQVNTERIIKISLSTKEGLREIIVELFSKGNLIICNQDNKILLPLRSQTWKDRKLKRGETYQLPPPRSTPLNTGKQEWCKSLVEQKFKNIAAYLATQAGLGGVWATKLCESKGIDPKAESVTKDQAQKIYEGYKDLFEHNNKASLSAQLQKEWEKDLPQNAPVDKKMQKIQAIINNQKEAVDRLKGNITQNNKKAELIYAHYQEMQDILAKAKQTKNIKELLSLPHVKGVDPKNKTVTVEFDDEL